MGKLEDLIAQVGDAALRQSLVAAASEVKETRNFGLVFEQHIPETVALLGLPVRRGHRVRLRSQMDSGPDFLVTKMRKKVLSLEAGDGTTLDVHSDEVAIVKRFGEPIYPTLSPIGAVRRSDGPAHTVINGENYHALQTLLYLHEGKVDCIYIDPPYNTGARDWKYNNNYVDDQDTWRHSKWLSFIEKRLILAKRLLKDDGVLIITIDENELHHLGMLLARVIPEARRQLVTICINPSGASNEGLSRVEEYAFFCYLGASRPVPIDWDLLGDRPAGDAKAGKRGIRWEWLLRGGGSWYRSSRPNLCYPVLLDEAGSTIVGVGEPFGGTDEGDRPQRVEGRLAAWPVRSDGRLGIWRVDGARLMSLVDSGYAFVSDRDEERGTWTLRYLLSGTIKAISAGELVVVARGHRGEVQVAARDRSVAIPKTVWRSTRHIAGGAGGTQMLTNLLGERNLFDYPKSVYAVRDSIAVAVGDRKNALVLDFFAGSGTTLHATCLLNAEDGGTRRSILVTNNELSELDARRLRERGLYRGDKEFEACGIFERVTRPRCSAAVSGVAATGEPIRATYLDGRSIGAGFEETVEYYNLQYLDPDSVRLGDQLDAILPMLRLAVGALGPIPASSGEAWVRPDGASWAVLVDDARFAKFRAAIDGCPELTHVWLVTTSEEAFARMRTQLRPELSVSMLYRDYLRNFEINTEQS